MAAASRPVGADLLCDMHLLDIVLLMVNVLLRELVATPFAPDERSVVLLWRQVGEPRVQVHACTAVAHLLGDVKVVGIRLNWPLSDIGDHVVISQRKVAQIQINEAILIRDQRAFIHFHHHRPVHHVVWLSRNVQDLVGYRRGVLICVCSRLLRLVKYPSLAIERLLGLSFLL